MLGRDWKKYAVLFFLLVITIGFVAGMFVANDSMEYAADEAFEKYNIEHGHFELKKKATEELREDYEDLGITIYEQFYKDFDEDVDGDGEKDAKIRVFKVREEVNKACLMEGEFPQAEGEIAIDRMHADNQGIAVGDTILLNKKEMKVTGLVASSDYSTLFENATDIMFDALTFDIGFVTGETYDKLYHKQNYQYAFMYNDPPVTDDEKSDAAEELAEDLAVLAATGGYTSDKDEAEELKDNVEEWTDYLEEIEDKADHAKELKEELEEEQAALEKKASDPQVVMNILMKAGYDQMAMLTMSQSQIAGIVKKALITDEMQAKIDELKELGDYLEGEEDQIDETIDRLEELEEYEDHTNELTDFVPEYANSAIHFAPDDFGRDKTMVEILLIILVALLAFIFGVTVNNIIVNDAAVIGTLRASGYTKGELVRHYTFLPIFISLLAALIGNVMGYTYFKYTVADMYYNSYSLPKYETIWNADAFVKTTVIPVILLVVIIVLIVSSKLQIEPLKFLRRDLSKSKRKRAVRLPNFRFLTRFRLRVFLHSFWDYLVLFLGIFFVAFLLTFSVGMPATLNNYQGRFVSLIMADYQYILRDWQDEDDKPIRTKNEDAEQFCMDSLKTIDGVHVDEPITVYGYGEDSKYFDVSDELAEANDDLPSDTEAAVCISKAYADKFELEVGDIVTLKESYTSDTHTFFVQEVNDYEAELAIMMPIERFRKVFELERGEFDGFISSSEITDLDDDNVLTVITLDDYTKIVNQLNHSMGSMMAYFSYALVVMAALLIYLLTKLIIEKNQTSISMVKVLGYTNGEINRIYVYLTTLVVVICTLLGAVISVFALDGIWNLYMYAMNGWFGMYFGKPEFIRVLLSILIAYLIISVIDMARIKRIPLTEALKNVE